MKFETQSGTKYWFDNILGISFPLNTSLEILLTSNDVTDSLEKEAADHQRDAVFNSRFMKKIEKARQYAHQYPKEQITPEHLKRQILREGLLQLTLSVTENCNLACRYCCYSDEYPNTRTPSHKMMNFETARTAIDYYASLLEEGKRFNPQRRPSVGFYGGEPLLNFQLIKQCVSYFKETYPEIDALFTMTTNGTLLDREKCEFLMAHDFSIAISLDGPEAEHNRNRVYHDGSGTFADVIKNIRPIMDAGYKNCHAICVFDWKSDLFALQEFFNRAEVPRISFISLPNPNDGCTFYQRFSREDYEKFLKTEAKAFQSYNHQIRHSAGVDSFFDQIFGLQAGRILYSVPALIDGTSFMIPYTFTCLPGRKIYVDVDGNYHICERINHTFPICNIRTGLDFARIAKIVEDYRSHLDLCPSCKVQKLCNICYCDFAGTGEFIPSSKICKNSNHDLIKGLERAFTIAENNPSLPETVAQGYYTWLSTISTTMGD
ncbi:MAG: radical SAM protein [Methanomicrobiales archaeon]|nr:radical SAM protein [Methanomicrobiales archaeon]